MQNNKLEEHIVELIESDHPEDVELGVIIAARKHGKEGCIRIFGEYKVGKGLYQTENQVFRPKIVGGEIFWLENDFYMVISAVICVLTNYTEIRTHWQKNDMRI